VLLFKSFVLYCPEPTNRYIKSFDYTMPSSYWISGSGKVSPLVCFI